MSTGAVGWALKVEHQGLTASEKALLVHLADRFNDDKGYAWPSLKRLQRDSLLSTRTISRLMVTLESKGLLVRKDQHAENHRQTVTHYVLPFYLVSLGCHGDMGGCQDVMGEGDTMTPRTTKSSLTVKSSPKEKTSRVRASDSTDFVGIYTDAVRALGAEPTRERKGFVGRWGRKRLDGGHRPEPIADALRRYAQTGVAGALDDYLLDAETGRRGNGTRPTTDVNGGMAPREDWDDPAKLEKMMQW